MRRPKGNDLRRAGFDGPAELAVLAHVAGRFVPGREHAEDEVNRILQAMHNDHASLRRHLVDAGLLVRERNVYRRA